MPAECKYCGYNKHPPGITQVVRWSRQGRNGRERVGPLTPSYCRRCPEGIQLMKERALREMITGVEDKYAT